MARATPTKQHAKRPQKRAAQTRGATKVTPSRVQGEGDYEAARRFRKQAANYMQEHDAGDIDKAARRAAPRNAGEKRELLAAEAKGRGRAAPQRARRASRS